MEQPAPVEKFLEEADLVKILPLGVLATVEHIGGETSSDESDDDEEEQFEDFSHFHNPPDPDPDRPALISQYEEDSDTGEGEEEEEDVDDDDGDEAENAAELGADTDTENAENAESLTAIPHGPNDHPDHDDEEEDIPEVPVGHALVTRIDSGKDVVVPITELEVVDRGLAPGQLVLSAVPGDTNLQSGAVHAVQKTVVVRRLSEWDQSEETFQVPAERLSFFSNVRVDGYVVMDNWLGVVEFIQEDVFVEFQCGAIAVVQGHTDARASSWLEADDPRVSPRRNPDAEGFFFPGMRVKAAPRVWREASWLRGRYRRQRRGTVRSTKITNVGVQWMAVRQNLSEADYDPPPQQPPDTVPYADVRPLDAFRALWWRAGDRAILAPEQPADDEQWVESTPAIPPARDERAASARPLRPARAPRRSAHRANGRLIAAQRRARELSSQEDPNALARPTADPAAVMQVVSTRTYIDVMWQNGQLERGIPSVNLRPNEHPGAFDFWPGLVVAKAGDEPDPTPPPPPPSIAARVLGAVAPAAAAAAAAAAPRADGAPAPKRTGVVVRALLNERTAVVRWQLPNSREYAPEEEELSFYDLTALSDYDMQVGDTALLVSRDPALQEGAGAEPRWVGEIIGKGVGDIRVRWLGGGESSVTPDQILVVSDSDEESEAENLSDYDEASEGQGFYAMEAMNNPEFRANWEITDPADITDAHMVDAIETRFQMSTAYTGGYPLQFRPSDTGLEDMQGVKYMVTTSRGWYMPMREVQTLTRNDALHIAQFVASSLVDSTASAVAFESTGIAPVDGIHPSWEAGKNLIKDEIDKFLREHQSSGDAEDVAMQSTAAGGDGPSAEDGAKENGVVKERSAETSGKAATDDGGPSAAPELAAPRFDVVEKFENHFYASRSVHETGQLYRRGFPNIVLKEYSRLKGHLPAGIFVRGSETQQDLLRAAIVGPPDTPYENVLFFFDIFLPMMYPGEPPKVHFWSHGRRLNPNLYEDGKVCLSILGTWNGDDVEQWDGRTSNVLRVLLSLQAMVFVEHPYYNEAGYEKQAGTTEGRTNSRTYNESTLLLCMRHLMQSNRTGGTPKDFEELKVEHYGARQKAIVGRLQKLSEDCDTAESEDANGPEGVQYTSQGFKRSLRELIPRVEESLKSASGPS